MTCLGFCAGALNDSWPLLAIQSLFVASQNFSVMVIMQEPQAISRWQASVEFILAQGYLPIVTAVFFSPHWASAGHSGLLFVTELELRRDRLVQERRNRLESRTPSVPTPTRISFELIDTELHDLELLNDKFTMTLKRWSTLCGCVWLLVTGASITWHAVFVWSASQYEFAETLCEEWSTVSSNLRTMRIYCA